MSSYRVLVTDNLSQKGVEIFQNTPGNIIIVNQKRFDTHKTFSNGLTFTEFAKKAYKNPRTILLPEETEKK